MSSRSASAPSTVSRSRTRPSKVASLPVEGLEQRGEDAVDLLGRHGLGEGRELVDELAEVDDVLRVRRPCRRPPSMVVGRARAPARGSAGRSGCATARPPWCRPAGRTSSSTSKRTTASPWSTSMPVTWPTPTPASFTGRRRAARPRRRSGRRARSGRRCRRRRWSPPIHSVSAGEATNGDEAQIPSFRRSMAELPGRRAGAMPSGAREPRPTQTRDRHGSRAMKPRSPAICGRPGPSKRMTSDRRPKNVSMRSRNSGIWSAAGRDAVDEGGDGPDGGVELARRCPRGGRRRSRRWPWWRRAARRCRPGSSVRTGSTVARSSVIATGVVGVVGQGRRERGEVGEEAGGCRRRASAPTASSSAEASMVRPISGPRPPTPSAIASEDRDQVVRVDVLEQLGGRRQDVGELDRGERLRDLVALARGTRPCPPWRRGARRMNFGPNTDSGSMLATTVFGTSMPSSMSRRDPDPAVVLQLDARPRCRC